MTQLHANEKRNKFNQKFESVQKEQADDLSSKRVGMQLKMDEIYQKHSGRTLPKSDKYAFLDTDAELAMKL